MAKFSDSSYNILKTYFDVIKEPNTGTDNSYILGQNHTIVADGGVFTKLYQENDDNDMIAHNFRIIDIIGNNFKFKYEGIATVHSAATELEVGKPMYFRKDEKFRDWLVNNIDVYEDFVNTNKLFIYFGMIYPVSDNTGKVGIHYNIEFEGMKNFVGNALPENNRNTNIQEFLDIYYDRTAHPIYNMTKGLWSLFDAKEVNLKHLDYLATRQGISTGTSTDLVAELPLREFVDNLSYWMKRKSSYTSYYIIHKILLANTRNKLNIYEKWAEYCLRDLRGDKNWTLPTDYETHHIRQHYGYVVSGGAGPEYYNQWNETGDDYHSDKVLSPKHTASDVLDDVNDIYGWRAKDSVLTTYERPGERWAQQIDYVEGAEGTGHGIVASEPFRMVQGHSYHFEYDAGCPRPFGYSWGIRIETPRASAGEPLYGSELLLNSDMEIPYGLELIENGEMEAVDSMISYSASASEQSTEQVYNGTYSWKNITTGVDQGSYTNTFTTETGKWYRLECYIYPTTASPLSVSVMEGGQAVWLKVETLDNLTPDAWNKVTFDALETYGGDGAWILITSSDATTFYIDDISYKEQPIGWTNFYSDDYEYTSEQNYNGENSLKVTAPSGCGVRSNTYETITGTLYKYTFYVKPTIGDIRVTGQTGQSNVLFSQLFTGLTPNVWNECTVSETEVEGGDNGQIYIFSPEAQTFYLDTVSTKPLLQAVAYSNERIYDKWDQKGYGEVTDFNTFQTSGAYIIPTVTSDDYQIKLYATHTSYYDNVYLVKIPTPKTGWPRPYPVFSDAPTADCRANTWDFGDDIDMQTFSVNSDDNAKVTNIYDTIIQVDDVSETDNVSVIANNENVYPLNFIQPDYTSFQSPSAIGGELNYYMKVNMDSMSKPSGGIMVFALTTSADGPQSAANDFIGVEYYLRHRDGNYTDGSATSGPARRWHLHEGYGNTLYSKATSGDYYLSDTDYHIGIHVVTQPLEKAHVVGGMADNTGFYFPVNGVEDIFNGSLSTTDGYLNTDSASASAVVYIDLGEGNEQAFSGVRAYRYGTTGTAPRFDVEASNDGFSSNTINLYSDWTPNDLGWNKIAWPNLTDYRFYRLRLQNSPGVNSGYTEFEFYKGDVTVKPEFRLNIYNKERMKDPNDLIESIRLPLHQDRWFPTVCLPETMYRETTPPSASIYYDLQDFKSTGGYVRSIAPTGNLVLTPHYDVEIDLSSEPMGDVNGVESIISIGQAEEVIRYWNLFKPVDKFVNHKFLISPIGKIDELHESVSLYDPLKLGICDTRFIGVETLSTSATPAQTNLIDNYLMNDTGYWVDYNEPDINERSYEQFYSPSASRKFTTTAQYTGIQSGNFSVPEIGYEYNCQAMVYPSGSDSIIIGVSDADTTEPDNWEYFSLHQGLNLGAWNKIEWNYTSQTKGPYSKIVILSPQGIGYKESWYVDDVYITRGKLDLFQETSVQVRTYATSQWPVAHYLNNIGVITQIFDPDENILYPKKLEITDEDRVRAYFNAGQRGRAFTAGAKIWGKKSNTYFFSEAASAWNITHNLGTSGAQGVCYQCYESDLSSNLVPQDAQRVDDNTLKITFPEPISGYCFIRDEDVYFEQTTANTSWHIQHNINARGLICHAYDTNGYRQYPETIEMEDYNTARIDWAEPVSGSACLLFFQRAFTEETLLNAMGVSGAGADNDKMTGAGGSRHGFWKIGDGDTLGFDPIIQNDLDSITASGNIDNIVQTNDSPSGTILFNFHVPQENAYTVTEMGIFDLDKNLQYYTKTSELHKPIGVQLDVRYRIRKLPTVV